MRQTVPETLRRLLPDQLSRRLYDRASGGEPLVADGGARSEAVEDTHVTKVPDGAGCTEIWEHLSERRDGGLDGDA